MKDMQTKNQSAGNAALLRAEFRRQLWKSAFFMLAAVAVIAVASIAWFVSNSQVHSGTAAVSAWYDPVRLATKGARQQVEIEHLDLPVGEQLKDENDVVIPAYSEYYYTEGGAIALRLDRKDYEISPGARGKVEFYIIPSHSGNTTVALQLGLGAYGENEEKEVVPIPDPVLNALMSGHILLFGGYEDGYYKDWLFQGAPSGTFHNALTVTVNGEADVPVPVRFYWIWPLRYENMANDLLDKNDPASGAFQDFIEDQAVFDDMTPLGGKEGYRYSRIFLTKTAPADDAARSKAYDLADEYIGSNAQYLYLTIQTSASDEGEGGLQP